MSFKIYGYEELLKNFDSLLEKILKMHHENKLYKAMNFVNEFEQSLRVVRCKLKNSKDSDSVKKLSRLNGIVKKKFRESKKIQFVFRDIKLQFQQAKRLLKELYNEDKPWKLANETSDGIKTWLKFGKDFSLIPLKKGTEKNDGKSKVATIKIEGDVNANILNVLSLLYEVDLYSSWVYRMNACKTIYEFGKYTFLCHFGWDLIFPFSNRDIICYGVGVDLLEEKKTLLIMVRSVEEFEYDYFEKLGNRSFKIPSKKEKDVRIGCHYCAYLIKPISKNKTHLKIMSSIDPKIDYIPTSLLNILIKAACPYVFKHIRKYAINIKDTKYAKRIKEKKDVYQDISKRLESMEFAQFSKEKHLYSLKYLGKMVEVTIDRPKGSSHPSYKNLIYEVNYGFLDGIVSGDNESLDAYVIGVEKKLKKEDKFQGFCVAVVCRIDDDDDKLVVIPKDDKLGRKIDKIEILKKVKFVEQYFTSEVFLFSNKKLGLS